MNFLQRLRLHLLGWPADYGTEPQREQSPERKEHDTDAGAPAALDQVERLNGSASLETLLEMNRVQGW